MPVSKVMEYRWSHRQSKCLINVYVWPNSKFTDIISKRCLSIWSLFWETVDAKEIADSALVNVICNTKWSLSSQLMMQFILTSSHCLAPLNLKLQTAMLNYSHDYTLPVIACQTHDIHMMYIYYVNKSTHTLKCTIWYFLGT